jgi:hypothetical protein
MPLSEVGEQRTSIGMPGSLIISNRQRFFQHSWGVERYTRAPRAFFASILEYNAKDQTEDDEKLQ